MSAPGSKAGPNAGPAGSARGERSFSAARSVLLLRKCACGGGASEGECASCSARRASSLQRSAAGPGPAAAPPIVGRVVSSPGRPLDSATRGFMEPRFGRDLGGVRIHTDPLAAESARAVDAHAYTVGQHIVFDSGKYDPHSADGRHLLAHELAHTVQQHGLQRHAGELSLAGSGESRRLESEADAAARSVMRGSAGVPSLASRPPHPLISRAERSNTPPEKERTTEESTPPAQDSAREWEPVPAGSALASAGVSAVARPDDAKKDLAVVTMLAPLQLPGEKGDKAVVEKLWNDRAQAGALEALVDTRTGEVSASPKLALKQGRPSTKELRGIWLEKMGWSPDAADKNWAEACKLAGQPPSTFDPPVAGGQTCHVDHIVELQFGGTNIPQNMQMLDGPENMLSGRTIFQNLMETATRIRAALPGVANVIIHYSKAEQSDEKCKACCQVERAAKDVKGGKAAIEGEPYGIEAGGTKADLVLPQKRDSVSVRSQSAATIIPGILLDTFNGQKGPGSDQVGAILDTGKPVGTKTRLPVTLVDEKPFPLLVQLDRKLKLADKAKHPNIKFHYDYLSEGTFDELAIEADGSISGKGSLKPSISFLPELRVRFDKDSFAVTAPIGKDKLKKFLPIPGFNFTEAKIELELAPKFKPVGLVSFEVAPGGRKVLDGQLTVTADAQGLVLEGDLFAHVPGVDEAKGHVEYRNKEWVGGVDIQAGDLQKKLKYVKSGSARIGFSSKGIVAEGIIDLAIPGTDAVQASLLYEKSKWLFRGKGVFKPPRLEPVEIGIEYDGDHLTGHAETGFTFHGIAGRIKVTYRDEKFSGEGTLKIQKGKAQGSLHVKMSPEHKFSGEGEIEYRITEGVIAKAGIAVDEQEKVRVKGGLDFPKPIALFKGFAGDYKIFEIGVSIPIPGASIGPIGLQARIEGALSAGYRIGPGELRNAKIEAALNPLEEKPDLDLRIGGQLFIGAGAHVTGSITGALEVSAGIASLTGGLTVSATASLDGHVASQVTVHYQRSRIEVDANFELLLALALTLALDAMVRAKAGIGPFSVETRKVWNLASFTFDTGMKLGMKLKKPIHYASDEPFQAPSLDDIEWVTPKLDPKQVLERTFSGAGGKEEEAR
ncbi:MAG TPA: DUF4157 domain-containing protein [Myxococcales bacterium]